MKVWTIEEIKNLLATNDKMVCHSLLKIYERQTASEKAFHETSEQNGIGYNGVDAKIMSSFAEYYKTNGYLSKKQIAIARNKIMKYSKQLTNIANGII